MSTVNVQIEVSDRVSALLARVDARFRDDARMHRMVATRGESLTRDYLREIAKTRHKTAERFGAKPTGHLARAAENVASRATSSEAVVSVTNPGITRAFGDVEIAGNPLLTIPVNANAYGRRARTLERDLGLRLFRPLKKGAKAQSSNLKLGPGEKGDRAPGRRSKNFRSEDKMKVLAAQTMGRLVIFYALAERVRQRQDRTLLPSDDAYKQAAMVGARDFIGYVFERMKGAEA